MTVRTSIRPTYDSRQTGPRFHVTTRVNGRTVEFQKRAADPFVRQSVHVGWLGCLHGLLRGRLLVEVIVGGDRDVVNDMLELDANQLVPGSTREAAFRSHVNEAIGRMAG